jgi:hypothetical protein
MAPDTLAIGSRGSQHFTLFVQHESEKRSEVAPNFVEGLNTYRWDIRTPFVEKDLRPLQRMEHLSSRYHEYSCLMGPFLENVALQHTERIMLVKMTIFAYKT